eukprot:jgi/Chrzof1/11467/Cz05g37200.t1
MHCLFECRHPALQLCRARFPVVARLPCTPRRMRDFMVPASCGPAQWRGVVHYVTACMRVLDRCYRHGGTDVPVVPDSRVVALPDDLYDDLLRPYQPDMVDSSVSSAPHDDSDDRDDAVSAPA